MERHQVIPDRIEAEPILSRSCYWESIQINNVLYEHLESYIAKLEEIGVHDHFEDSIFAEKQTQ